MKKPFRFTEYLKYKFPCFEDLEEFPDAHRAKVVHVGGSVIFSII